MSPLRLAVTGYVSEEAGSVASANALLLRALLERGCEVVFFSKASFVDPRPAVGAHPAFRFVNVENRAADRLRARVAKVPFLGFLAARWDSASYHRALLAGMRREHGASPFHAALWLGEYARGPLPGAAVISYAQGPPGTDARSILHRFGEICALAGLATAWKWRLLAALRLSRLGLPPLHWSERIIVGSRQSCQTLEQRYGIAPQRLAALPYPIDLAHFRPAADARAPGGPLRVLWLGRIIPRKRLDLFLDAAALALRQGVDLRLTVVGGVGFIPGYERLLRAFPEPARLEWLPHLPREEVPALFARHDLLVQPSEEENFGSSVAEAQACGLPVIVGATNGNADYLCEHDLRLADDAPQTLATALAAFATKRAGGTASRQLAERCFALDAVADRLLALLQERRGGG